MRLRPHQIEPDGDEGDVATIVSGRVQFAAPGSGMSLEDLSDVDTSGASVGDVLTYDGTDWVPAAPEVPALAASDLSTWLVHLVTTDPSGDFVDVWTDDGEHLFVEVPL